MQTNFSPAQLTDPDIAEAERVIRKCVHCGFCTATCPTYVLLGDERDSPRGRIYLIKEMLEADATPTPEVVTHIDRCLSCLACVTTCPSGVDYRRLIDQARAHVHNRYRRPWPDRAWRSLLAWLLPNPRRFAVALRLAPLAKPFAGVLGRAAWLKPAAAMLALAPASAPRPCPAPAAGARGSRGRVILLKGCAEPVLAPHIRAAAVRLLARMGFETLVVDGEGCCGALTHHLGRDEMAAQACRRNIDAWAGLIGEGGVAAILTTASGCGSMIKDYGFLLRSDPAYAAGARTVSDRTADISEFIDRVGLPPVARRTGLTVAYHAACSLQHGQQITQTPKRLLLSAGFEVLEPVDAHLCCGSAGTYNILQADLAERLKGRKLQTLEATGGQVIAAGNIGCLVQIASGAKRPVVHTIELLDWATGGPTPQALLDRPPPQTSEKKARPS
jgi:glycolate oxidase iron-sulfur subunit